MMDSKHEEDLGRLKSMIKNVKYEDVVADLEAHPNKRLFFRFGYKYKGGREKEISRDPKDYPREKSVCIDLKMYYRTMNSWKDELKAAYEWACIVEIESDSDEELHLEGLDEGDMW
jgi:hypothetical protein